MPPGSPNLFRLDIGRNLNRVFPPERGGFEVPSVLGGVVSLVHDFPGTSPHLATSIYDAVGAAGVVQILAAVVPPDGYIWLVEEISIFCSDPISRTMSLRLRYVTSLGTFTVALFRVDTPAVAVQVSFPVGRRFVMPPQSILDLSVPAIAGAENLRWTFAYHQLPAGQFVPKY